MAHGAVVPARRRKLTMPHRVVITGIGPVTSAGVGKETFFDGIWNNKVNPQPIPADFTRKHAFRSKWYVRLPELSGHPLNLTHENLMQPEDRMSVLGCRLALEDAGYAVKEKDGRLSVEGLDQETGILVGTGLSGLKTLFDSYLCHYLPPDVLRAVNPEQRHSFARLVIPKTMPNSPAAWISISFNLTGPSHTLNASCSSGTYAVGEAFRRLKDGYASVVLTGGVECLQDDHGAIMRGFDALGALTQSPDGRPTSFGKRRSGFLFAEGGACLLVLEQLEHALQRRARIYAEIADFRTNSDAFNIVQIDPEGKQINKLLRGLSDGRKIDYINAHGTGTVANDEVEARAVQSVFGERYTQPLINSTKGLLGHTVGASGAIEAAVTALSIARGTIHGNRTDDPMDNLNLPINSVEARIENALSVSYGFGGHNGGLLFKKYER